MVVDRVASGQMDPVAIERDRALAFPAVAHRTRDDTLLVRVKLGHIATTTTTTVHIQ